MFRPGLSETTAQVGVRGMGEVFRGDDTKLKRQGPLKVPPASVAADKRLARVEREAEVLAFLNHSNIAINQYRDHSWTRTNR